MTNNNNNNSKECEHEWEFAKEGNEYELGVPMNTDKILRHYTISICKNCGKTKKNYL